MLSLEHKIQYFENLIIMLHNSNENATEEQKRKNLEKIFKINCIILPNLKARL